MNVSMWIKALRVVPRLNKDEWDKLDVVSRWLVATRSFALVLSFMAAAIGGLLAAGDGVFDVVPWLVTAIGLVFAHGANNLLNDLVDYQKGVDKANYYRAQYGPQPLESGLMTKKQLITYFVATGAIAALCGLYLVSLRGTPVLILMLIGAFFVLFYTFPLKYIGLGELTVLLVWGPLMIAGTYFVLSGVWDWMVVVASLPFGLSVSAALFGKHIDKYAADKAKKIHTFPVIVGERPARYITLAMLTLQYLIVVYLVVVRYFTPVMLVVALALPSLVWCFKMFRYPRPESKPDWYPENIWPLWFVATTFDHSRKFGGYLMMGLIVDVILRLAVPGFWV
jgi:1,4-dihydroxy-2-naphthoate polyprenyltransferase